MQTYTVATPLELPHFTNTILAELTASCSVVALHGELGAGKTAFVQALAQTLGVTEPVTSPTFAILNRYTTSHARWQTLLHMDAYRIEHENELGPLRFSELITQPDTIFCIEWAAQVAAALPPHTLHLTFSIDAIDARVVAVESHKEWLART